MKFLNTSLLLLVLPSLAHASEGTRPLVKARQDQLRASGTSRMLALCTQCETIQLAFHLLRNPDGTGETATLWNATQISSEIDNLNDLWQDTPFMFELRENDGISYQSNADWNQVDLRIKSALHPIAQELRVGNRTTANVFINDGPVCIDAGWATEDRNEQMFPLDTYIRTDRVSLCGKVPSYINPHILTHEIGHWLGLQHTFQGDTCDPDAGGDGIDDTPTQGASSNGMCVEGQDTCPDQLGADAIHNYMDYSSCEDKEFTEGQKQRMYDNFEKYRKRSVPCTSNEARLGFDFEFDANAADNRLTLVKWGESSSAQTVQYMDRNTVYANKQAVHSICIPRNIMHEIRLVDNGRNGISPGHFAYSLNGEEFVRKGAWSDQTKLFDSVIIAGDSEKCAAGQGRFVFQAQMDERPNDITWIIKDATGTTVADSTAITAFGQGVLTSNFKGSDVIFDKCLDAATYTFTISDSNGDGFLQGYYSLSVNGVEEHKSDAADGSFGAEETIDVEVAALPAEPEDPPEDPPSFDICFSSSSTVEVMDQGRTELKDVKLGDSVHVGNGIYEPVYSFGHFNLDVRTDFLQIKTDKTTLRLTNAHMVFSEAGSVPASMIKVGDQLLDAQGDKLSVKSIKSISSDGVVAPFTPSGKIVVDGVLASSFIAFENNSHLSFWGISFSQQWLAHSFEFPHRLACNYLTQCRKETYTPDGVSTWVATPFQMTLWMLDQSKFGQGLFGALAVTLLVIFNILEFMLLHPLSVATAAAAVGAVSHWKLGHSSKKV